jgi:hypothetical protein
LTTPAPATAVDVATAIGGSATTGEVNMATKDKNSSKSNLKKPAQKTLKEKRQAKKDKK